MTFCDTAALFIRHCMVYVDDIISQLFYYALLKTSIRGTDLHLENILR